MSEVQVEYELRSAKSERTALDNPLQSYATITDEPGSTNADTLRSQLTDMERQLISLLVTVQRALGKEPSVITRSERRRG